MGFFSGHNPLVLTFGLLGNVVSLVVFLAPLPTFYRVCKKKSTEGFQSLPYVVALFSAILWIYYAIAKTGETLLISINAVGCVIETIYIAIYIVYAPKPARTLTLRLVLLMDFGGLCAVILLSHFLAKGEEKAKVLGWICVAVGTSVFAAPLSIMRVVIRTKSVEFMPFTLSLFLTLSAVMWLLYGLMLKDFYVAFPNILGLVFGVAQMVLYVIYKNHNPVKEVPETKAGTQVIDTKTETPAPAPAPAKEFSDKSRDVEMGGKENMERAVPRVQTVDRCNDDHKPMEGFLQGPPIVICQV